MSRSSQTFSRSTLEAPLTTYYDSHGHAALEAALTPEPGVWVAIYDERMLQLTTWAPISLALTARWPQPLADGHATHAVLWDGGDRLRRQPIDRPTPLFIHTGAEVALSFPWPGRLVDRDE